MPIVVPVAPAIDPIKLLYIGDSSTGKTGSLASLAGAGYRLGIIDLDGGTEVIKNLLTSPTSKYPRDSMSRVFRIQLTEDMHFINGKFVPKMATSWSRLGDLLNKFKGTDPTHGPIDLGPVAQWGSNDILIIDSLTAAAQAALEFHYQLGGKLINGSSGFEYQRDIGTAQGYVEQMLRALCSKMLKCNVIVISHITYVADKEAPPPMPNEQPAEKGFPSAIGRAASPRIPQKFNHLLQAKFEGQGIGSVAKIFTKTQGPVLLKTAAPMTAKASYPLETGLADFFRAVRGQ